MTEKDAGLKLGGSAKDRIIVQLREELARTRKELKKAHVAALEDEAIREIIGTLSAAPAKVPAWTVDVRRRRGGPMPEVPVFSWADWHGGETVNRDQLNGVNEYTLAIMAKRVRRLVEKGIDLARNHGPGAYPGAIVNLLGDFVSGGLHPELLKTDELDVMPSVLYVSDLLVWGLQAMADEFGQIYAPAVAGNHGRNTPKPEFKNYRYKNWDWLIYEFVRKRLADRKDDRIIIDTRPSNEVHYRIFAQRNLIMHGDMLGVKGGDGIIGALGPVVRGEIKVRGWADSSGMPYDHMTIGHWHQEITLKRLTVANTLKGYCEYAKNALRAPISDPSQPLRFVHPKYGTTSRWEILVEGKRDAVNLDRWISVSSENPDFGRFVGS